MIAEDCFAIISSVVCPSLSAQVACETLPFVWYTGRAMLQGISDMDMCVWVKMRHATSIAVFDFQGCSFDCVCALALFFSVGLSALCFLALALVCVAFPCS